MENYELNKIVWGTQFSWGGQIATLKSSFLLVYLAFAQHFSKRNKKKQTKN